MFDGKNVSHILPFTKPEYKTARQKDAKRISISGVQTKHSLRLNKKILELTDQGGGYILKPVPNGDFDRMQEMPANEHVTMQLATQVFGLDVAANGLVFFEDGEPAYLTKRFDQEPDGSRKLQEDFAQLAGRTEESNGSNYKYDSSYEEIADLMRKFIGPYAIEAEKYFRLVLFNYLIQNGDAHLKNFSVFRDPGQGIYVLTPAYDLMNTRLHLPTEADTALDLFKDDFATESYEANAYYAKDDFLELGKRMGMGMERVKMIIAAMIGKTGEVETLIGRARLEEKTKNDYLAQVNDRVKRLNYTFKK